MAICKGCHQPAYLISQHTQEAAISCSRKAFSYKYVNYLRFPSFHFMLEAAAAQGLYRNKLTTMARVTAIIFALGFMFSPKIAEAMPTGHERFPPYPNPSLEDGRSFSIVLR